MQLNLRLNYNVENHRQALQMQGFFTGKIQRADDIFSMYREAKIVLGLMCAELVGDFYLGYSSLQSFYLVF